MNEEKYSVGNCSICTHECRNKIEDLLMSGMRTQKSIAEEFSISPPALCNHRNKHMLENLKDHLKAIIFERVRKNALKDASFSEVINALKYIEESDKKLEIAKNKSIEESINEFLGTDFIKLLPEEYSEFADFIKNMKTDLRIAVNFESYTYFRNLYPEKDTNTKEERVK